MNPSNLIYEYLYYGLFKDLNFSLSYTSAFSDNPKYDVTFLGDINTTIGHCLMIQDQEPIIIDPIDTQQSLNFLTIDTANTIATIPSKFKNIFYFNTEHGAYKSYLIEKYSMQDIYYFSHALISLEWFRHYRYQFIEQTPIHKLFSCHNHILNSIRLGRIEFLCQILESGLIDNGYVSNKRIDLSKRAEICARSSVISLIEKHQAYLEQDHYLDTNCMSGTLSRQIDLEHITKSFVYVVTETHDGWTPSNNPKKHLTEKIFKPIVAKQPFLLVGSYQNLAYLRSYGFKTFGDYWDESYDDISNREDRIKAVVNILSKLNDLPYAQLIEIRNDMNDIIEHNWWHFYDELRPIVVTELINNITNGLKNCGITTPTSNLQRLYRILVK